MARVTVTGNDAPYCLTDMKGGGWRAECHIDWCLWWEDTSYNDETGEAIAFRSLRLHMRRHGIEASKRKALSEG